MGTIANVVMQVEARGLIIDLYASLAAREDEIESVIGDAA